MAKRRSDKEIIRDWTGRLNVRKGLERDAKAAHRKAQTALDRARASDAHPRQALVDARDKATEKLKLRRRQVAQAERVIARAKARQNGSRQVAAPCVTNMATNTNRYRPPGHDGIDLITKLDAPLYAICDGRIVDVRSGGWWGKGAQASHGHPISDGDGIIQLECTVDVGPFKKGMIFGYGHAEHATVKKGERVQAGDMIGRAGFANAPHPHFMARGPMTASERSRGRPSGVGTMDPEPFVRYAIAND
ncbi:MAG: M23 family metallopeptidase [Chloroflexi bacterium]|nr:M23 family metallopeptidase [Chloroflexota bacterium]